MTNFTNAVAECESALVWASIDEQDVMEKDDALFPALRLVLDALEEARKDRALRMLAMNNATRTVFTRCPKCNQYRESGIICWGCGNDD